MSNGQMVSVTMRMRGTVVAQLKMQAEKNGRTLSAEIRFIVAQALRPVPKRKP